MLDTANKFVVTEEDEGVVINYLPIFPMTKDDAVLLAAWLLAIADPGLEKFDRSINSILGS